MTRNQELERARQWRRDLHQIPELGLDLPLTKDYILHALEGLSCQISSPIDSAVAAFFDAGKETTIAFRSDMDALPIAEQSGCEFESRHPGKMHACGHDGHMTNLLLFAHRLESYYHTLDHNVLLIFQPAEEGPGGALPICQSGLLEEKNVQAVFGLHLWPLLEKGTVATRPGGMMAHSSEIDVDIQGKAVHVARCREGIDAIEVGAHFLQQAYELERSLPKQSIRILRFGKMQGGSVRNAIADTCRLEGTMRAFEDEYFFALQEGLKTITQELSEETGATITVHFANGYPPVMNDPKLTRQLLASIPQLAQLEKPEMISEDFAWYQKYVPGVFFFLGTGTGIELHDPRFNFEEDLLLNGTDLFEAISRQNFTN